jgi:FHS family L-fucose permease-like MFS transporter
MNVLEQSKPLFNEEAGKTRVQSDKKLSVPVVPKSLIIPFCLVTSLFALWGFANAVTDPMVQAFKKVLELTNTQASWVQMAFYGGYFCMALPAALFVRKYSYKAGILFGLALYAIGAFVFYPAATFEAFWMFCLGLYILTFGLAFLETTANPYILSMGSKITATQRLNLAQAFNPVGLISGLLVAQYFVLSKLQSDDITNFAALENSQKLFIRSADLMVIRNPYVILGLVVLFVGILILFFKMPLGKNDKTKQNTKEVIQRLIENKRYISGVISQVLYVGAQIMCWTYIYQYAEAIGVTAENAATYQLTAFILFIIGRAIGTALLRIVSPGTLLAYFCIGAGACTLLAIFFHTQMGLISLVGISFFMSLMFPTIYGIALEKLSSEETTIGAAGLVMAIVGGAIMPMLQGAFIDLGGDKVNDLYFLEIPEVNYSFFLPFLCFVGIFLFGYRTHRSDRNFDKLEFKK